MPIFGLHPAGLLETIFEETGIALTVLDQRENLVFANRTALDLLGGTAERPTTFREWRKYYRLEDAEGHEIRVEDSAALRALHEGHVETQQVRARLQNGSSKWLLIWAYPFSTMGLAGVIVIILDETIEVELRRAVSQLQRMETLGAVASGFTHNLNNLLDTITLSAETARRDGISMDECQGRLSHISAAAARAAELVRRLMQFGRTQDMHFEAVQINDVICRVLHLVDPLFRQNVIVKTDLSGNLPLINADATQLEQVLVNLIVNALDAMPEGGELTISTAADPTPDFSVSEKKEGLVSIAVADTGIGIPEESQPLIFDPFYTTKPAGKGTGLGLSSVYGIVTQHKGSVTVQSVPGRGTTFVICLPVLIPSSTRRTAAD